MNRCEHWGRIVVVTKRRRLLRLRNLVRDNCRGTVHFFLHVTLLQSSVWWVRAKRVFSGWWATQHALRRIRGVFLLVPIKRLYSTSTLCVGRHWLLTISVQSLTMRRSSLLGPSKRRARTPTRVGGGVTAGVGAGKCFGTTSTGDLNPSARGYWPWL
jgi:hypothetical protein